MIQTAKEFLNDDPGIEIYNLTETNPELLKYIEENLIDFTILHVKEALKQASEKAKIITLWEGNTGSEYCEEVIDRNSILNAYSLDNIK